MPPNAVALLTTFLSLALTAENSTGRAVITAIRGRSSVMHVHLFHQNPCPAYNVSRSNLSTSTISCSGRILSYRQPHGSSEDEPFRCQLCQHLEETHRRSITWEGFELACCVAASDRFA